MALGENVRETTIREVLEHWVLDHLDGSASTLEEIAEAFGKASSENLDISTKEVESTIMEMTDSGLLLSRTGRLAVSEPGERKLAEDRAKQDEAKKRGEEAKEAAVEKLIRCLESAGGRRVIDVGTGEGYLALKLSEAGFDVVGVDKNAERIGKARTKAKDIEAGEVRFEVGDIANAEGLGQFDFAVARYVVHHLDDQEEALKAVRRVVKPEGKLVCIDYLVGLPAFWVHGFVTFRAPTKEEWPRLLQRCGYERTVLHPVDDLLVVEATASGDHGRRPARLPRKPKDQVKVR